MTRVRIGAAWLLALPLALFGMNYFLQFIPDPEDDGSRGYEIIMSMRAGGLMLYIALSHVAVALLLVVPRLRFPGALLQLPLSLGILAFHATLMPAGLPPAIVMVVLNALVLLDGERGRALFARSPRA